MNLNSKILGTMFLTIASVTGLLAVGNFNSAQASLGDIFGSNCLAGCITNICPANISNEATGGSATNGDQTNEGNMAGVNDFANVDNSYSQTSAYACEVGSNPRTD